MKEQKTRIDELEEQLADFKSKDYIIKSKREVIEQIVKDYFSGIDSDVASLKIQEANAFL